MSAALERTHLPAEFRGRARQFRDHVRVLDRATEHALTAITAPLRARLKRHPKLRQEQIAATLRSYAQTVPSQLRIGPVSVCRHPAKFSIAEVRLIVSWCMVPDEWGDEREQGVAIARYVMALEHGRLSTSWRPVALVSLHALGRRIERGTDRSPDAILADLARLADAGADGDRVPAGDGFWIGKVIPIKGPAMSGPARHVRTWHS